MKVILEGGIADGQEDDRYPFAVPRVCRERKTETNGVIRVEHCHYDLLTDEFGEPELDAFGRPRYRAKPHRLHLR